MESTAEWNARFLQQARWTEPLRASLLKGLNLSRATRGLEVGCGTGVISAAMPLHTSAALYGIDLRADFLSFAHDTNPSLSLSQANGLFLPFADACFDFVFCHFVLLWIENPAAMVMEMRRATRTGGIVLALAEPDYGGRIDHPARLQAVAGRQSAALRRQGAQPETGRHLAELFVDAGLVGVRSGVLGGQWGSSPSPEEIEAEQAVLAHDLAGDISQEELANYLKLDTDAWHRGTRILYIPTFYAWGFVPER